MSTDKSIKPDYVTEQVDVWQNTSMTGRPHRWATQSRQGEALRVRYSKWTTEPSRTWSFARIIWSELHHACLAPVVDAAVVSLVCFAATHSKPISSVAFFATLAISLGMVARRHWFPKHPVRSVPTPAEQFNVRIRVEGEGFYLGDDSGTANFVDGWLHFEGMATSFAMRCQHVGRCTTEKSKLVCSAIEGYRDHRVEIALLRHPQDLLTRSQTKAFASACRSWRIAKPVACDVLVLPPKTPRENALVRVVLTSVGQWLWTAFTFLVVRPQSLFGLIPWLDHAITSAATWLSVPWLIGIIGESWRFKRTFRDPKPRAMNFIEAASTQVPEDRSEQVHSGA